MLNLLYLIVIIPVISIMSMIYGWGLTPISWPVIIGLYYLMVFIGLVAATLDK